MTAGKKREMVISIEWKVQQMESGTKSVNMLHGFGKLQRIWEKYFVTIITEKRVIKQMMKR